MILTVKFAERDKRGGHRYRERERVSFNTLFDLCSCAAASSVRSSPLRRQHGVQVQEQLCRSALHTRPDGLDWALMQPTICCVRAQSAREFVTEFSGGATPHQR